MVEGGQEGWLREWIREKCEKKPERLLAEGQSPFFSLYTCFSCPFSPALAGQAGWGGVEILLEKFHIRGLHVLAPWRGASLEAPALLPKLCSRSPAWLCCAPFKWIYGPINGESLCTIKSRTDLSGIQFNNYLSNSIIFRYVVSVSADLEDLLGAFDRQDSTLSCSVTNPALHRPHTHLKTSDRLWRVCLSLDVEKDVQRTYPCSSPCLRAAPLANYEKLLRLC